ncbi:MAG: ABC transporter permease [Rhodothermia bacterium]|nr:MAG: ABC transporter permease [Rhodothermia bacterium]
MPELERNIPFWRISWRNTRRNTRRTLLTATAVAVAVASMTYAISHIDGIMNSILDTYSKTESGHVRIRKEGYSERDRSLPAHLGIRNLSEIMPVVEMNESVVAVLPRIRAAVLVDGVDSNRPGMLLGVDLDAEEGYLNPSAMVTSGRLPNPGSPAGFSELLIGEGMAERLDASLGDTLTLLTQTSYRSLGALRFVVTGIGTTGLSALDSRLMLTSIDEAQLLIDLEDGATEIVVFAAEPDEADVLAADLISRFESAGLDDLEVLSWTEQGPLVKMMDSTRPLMGIILFILLLMASLIIVNTMMMTVMERTREFGMLAALGLRRWDIARLIILEGLAIGFVGALVGGALGTAVAIWISQIGIDVSAATTNIDVPFKSIMYPNWTLAYSLASALLGMLTAVLASCYPAWRAVRKTPAEAMHD